MALRPEIFVSAVVPELNAFRKVVKQTLLSLGARPVEQTDYSVEYGPLHGILSQLLQPCEAVIHLVGFDYGMEPAERTLHAPRRSFTQYEVEVARLLEKPVYVFATTSACQAEPHKWEDEERRFLQSQHRSALERSGPVTYFSTAEELAQGIKALRPKLIVRHSLARLPARPQGARFVGRSRMLEELAATLAPGRIDVLHPAPGSGPSGGQGKTALAIETGWRVHDEHRFDFVFWMPAGPQVDLEVSLAALARTDSLSLLPDEVVSHRARYQAVLHWFAQEENAGRWLMIIDGVDDEIAWWSLRTILPSLGRGAILVTTCRPPFTGSHGHSLAGLSMEQAREFLLSRMDREATLAPAEKQAWDRLAESLGRLPLVLEIAFAHLRATKQTAREFLNQWAVRSKTPVALTAVAMIEHAVLSLDPIARNLLRTLSCLDAQPAAIPIALFEHRGDWPANSAALDLLVARGFLQRDESGNTVSLHRLIREIVRDRLSPIEFTAALGAARVELDAVLQRANSTEGPRSSLLREMLIPHCRAVLGQLNGHPLELHASGLAQTLGEWLKQNGRLIEAETFYRRALAIEERRLGPVHEDLAPRLRDLIATLRTLRRLREADELSRRLINLHEAIEPQDLSQLSADLTQYAATLRAGNSLTDAESICRQALDLAIEDSGPDHPKVAIALHHLAGILEAQHRRREAEPLYRRALSIEERAFGSSHPRLATRLSHLAWSLLSQGRRHDAEALFRRALVLDEAQLGTDHVELAPLLDALGGILEDDGNLEEAQQSYRRALAICESSLGSEHPETAMVLTNLGAVLEEMGSLEEAKGCYERSAHILFQQTRRMRGPHPQLRSALRNLGRVLRLLGDDDATVEDKLAQYRPVMPKRVRSKFLDDLP